MVQESASQRLVSSPGSIPNKGGIRMFSRSNRESAFLNVEIDTPPRYSFSASFPLLPFSPVPFSSSRHYHRSIQSIHLLAACLFQFLCFPTVLARHSEVRRRPVSLSSKRKHKPFGGTKSLVVGAWPEREDRRCRILPTRKHGW